MLLCVARCEPAKRIEIVIEAFADVLERHEGAHLVIVGEIDDRVYYEELTRLIVGRGIAPKVRFLSAVEDIRAVHAAADGLMLTSLREPLGTAILEAMAMQTPVIAFASGGIPEMIDETCGTLVDQRALPDFAAILRRLVAGDRDLMLKARRARQIVLQRFSLDEHVAAVRRVYLELT